MNVKIEELPDHHVAYIRKLGPYGPETSGQAFMELGQWAGPRGYFNGEGKVLGVYWDNPEITPAEKCRTDACLTVPEGTDADGGISLQTLVGGRTAVCHFKTTADGFKQSWDDAFAWLVESGHEVADRPCMELYHNDGSKDPQGIWDYDICIPLK